MYIFTLALGALVAAAVDARILASETVNGRTLRADSSASRHIMEHAVRVNRKGERILQDENNQNSFELTAMYSFNFDKCVSVRTEPSDSGEIIFDANLVTYASKGEIVPQMSYILFNVCKTKYCDYYKSDDNLYMIDIGTYMAAIADYYVTRHEAYCDACVDSYNYCKYVEYQKSQNQNYNEYAGAEGFYSSSYYGGRDLSRYNFEVIDCTMCSKMECFTEYVAQQSSQNQQNQNAEGEEAVEEEVSTDMESIAAWVDELTQCKDTSVDFLDYYRVYAGFMCNEDGSGVDIATFLDEACMIYNSHTSFTTVASTADQTMMAAAADMITYPFLHQINCNGDYAYYSMDEYRQQAQNYQYNNDGNNNYNSNPSDYCQAVFQGGQLGDAISLRDCDEDGQEDDRSEEEQEEGAEVDEYVDNDYSWFSYTLSNEDAQDTEKTCVVIRKMQGEYETIYRWAGSGQLFNYGTGPSNKSSFFSSQSMSGWFSKENYEKMRPPLIVAITLASVVALTAFACILYSCCSPSSAANKYAEQKVLEERRAELDAKREHLVDASTGKLM